MATTAGGPAIESYEQACAEHEWSVPERYNIAADVCDKHPRDKAAMVWEHYDGATRELDWGELQDLSNQAAHMLREHGVGKGDRVAVVLPPTPETAAIFFGTWKLGGILLSMSVLYGDDGIRHRLTDSTPKVLVTDSANAGRFDASLVDEMLVLDEGLLDGLPHRPRLRGHLRRRPGAALLHLRHHGQGEGHRPRPPLHPRPRGVRLLPRDPRRRELPRHGRVGLGRGHLPAARPVAPRRGPVRAPARGGLRPRRPARLPLPPPGLERVHDPDGDAGDDGDRRRRRALPAGVPDRLLGGRAAEPRGDPLVSRPVRGHGARLLRAHRVLSAVRELPVHGGPRGLDGPADARLGRADPRRGFRTRSPRASAARSACARARTRTTRSSYWNLPEASEETFGGEWFHTKDAATMDEDGYVWYAGRADDVIIAAGYRIGPFEVESACIEHPAVREAAAVASPDEVKGNVVKAFIVLADGPRAVRRARQGDPGLRPRATQRLRLPAPGRVRRRAAEDAHGQDPADRTARGRARARLSGAHLE